MGKQLILHKGNQILQKLCRCARNRDVQRPRLDNEWHIEVLCSIISIPRVACCITCFCCVFRFALCLSLLGNLLSSLCLYWYRYRWFTFILVNTVQWMLPSWINYHTKTPFPGRADQRIPHKVRSRIMYHFKTNPAVLSCLQLSSCINYYKSIFVNGD